MPTYNHFQEIPTFLEGSYRIDVELDRIEPTLEMYEDWYGLDLDPDYQRGHVWSEAQQIAFVEHVLRGGRNTIIRWNRHGWRGGTVRMPGSIAPAAHGPMQIVDGKQRLTAIRQFLANDLPAFGTLVADFDGAPPPMCGLQFIVNGLVTRTEVLQWYLELNEGNVAHTPEELARVYELLSVAS